MTSLTRPVQGFDFACYPKAAPLLPAVGSFGASNLLPEVASNSAHSTTTGARRARG